MNWRHWFRHDWEKWSKAELATVNWANATKLEMNWKAEVQSRSCKTCNKMQVRRIDFEAK
ncbi:hypothetical protein LCGC14_0483680 [marine sediment metagenome]|uniref:Uncharacterized protein n=1 Tax=marine sediment metagenome TaxID=412755 RepID=A0A0F9SRU3_9ZZZZ